MVAIIKRFALWQWVIFGLVTGVLAGFQMGEDAAMFKWVGEIFINLIMMVIAPLVFFSIVSGVISLGDPKMLGRMGSKALLAFIITTFSAIILAFFLTNAFAPGEGVSEEMMMKLEQVDYAMPDSGTMEAPTLTDILLNVVPNNAIAAFNERNILQVIFFAVLVGAVMVSMREKTKVLEELVHETANIFYKIIEWVILLAPIAVFALTAWAVGIMGIDALELLSKFVVVVVVACFLQYLVLVGFVSISGRVSPLPFMKKSLEYQLLGFSTSSSTATMPTTMKVCTERLGVSKMTTSMIVPLGATVNMNGTAIYLGACTVFLAQLYGIHLSIEQYVIVATTITLVAIGTAAVPGGSLAMMPIIFSLVGIPIEAIGLVLGVDRILDMLRTTVNVTGDAAVSMYIDRSEGQFNEELYNNMDTDSIKL